MNRLSGWMLYALLPLVACKKDPPTEPELPQPPQEPPALACTVLPKEAFQGENISIKIPVQKFHRDSVTAVSVNGIALEVYKTYYVSILDLVSTSNIPILPLGPVKVEVMYNGRKYTSSETKVIASRASWEAKAPMPMAKWRYGAVSFVIGQKAYVGTGADYRHDLSDYNAGMYNLYGRLNYHASRMGGFRDDLREYDPATDQWKELATFPGGVRYGAVGFSIGNKGYIGLGHSNDTSSYPSPPVFNNDLWEYDPAANTWTKMPDLPAAARTGAFSFSLGNKAYVSCGTTTKDHETVSDMWEFDGTTKSWKQLGDFPGEKPVAGPARATLNGKGYVQYGMQGALWEYNPQGDTWTRKANLEDKRRFGGSGFALNGKLYFGIGHHYYETPHIPYNSSESDFWEYDPATDKWTKLDYSEKREAAFSFAIGNHGYIGGGMYLNQSGNHRIDAVPVTSVLRFTRK